MDNPLKEFKHESQWCKRFCLKCRKKRLSVVVVIEVDGMKLTLKRCLGGHESFVSRKVP